METTMESIKGKTVYISGSISADPDYRAKFNRAEKQLLTAGARRVINPACLPDGWEYGEYLEHCMLMVRRAEVIALLPCWSFSPGAKAERAYAESLRLPIVDLVLQ